MSASSDRGLTNSSRITLATLQPLIPQADTKSWLLLAAGSTLAGNLTLFGAVANLITVEASADLGYKLTFWEHLRFGVPLTLLTVTITYLWIN
jgi:Na+/H+ antiporter NhaD/arsenite permease-like protein